GLLGASAILVALFWAIELRSAAPLLPPRMLRNRTLTAANVTIAIIGTVAFSEFFLLTLYLQEGLGYSPLESGIAFTAFALTVVVASNVAQALVSRIGVRAVLVSGLSASAISLAYLTRLPLDGNYVVAMFPAFVLGGAGMGLSFVPVTIAGLSGVQPSDAGVASGLLNTARQIGGAIGIAAVSSIAATSTSNYLQTHAAGPAALD